MKFLKTSIVLLFLLSLLTAGVSFYLSTIRENEKEKRVYLEGVRTQLEGQVSELEGENSDLEGRIASLELEKKDLQKKLRDEKAERERILKQIQEKDVEIEQLREEAREAGSAFENAEKRNRELERILDELESRMKLLESQGALPKSETGYLDVTVTPINPGTSQPVGQTQPATDAASETVVPQTQAQAVPATTLPEPPKRRRFFPFFRSSDDRKKETSVTTRPAVQAPVATETPPRATDQDKAKAEAAPAVSQTVQNIAAGSVLLLNRQYNFLVTNLGSRQGLVLDDVVSIQRDGSEVAKARVEKLYEDYSAAYIIEEQSERPIQEGDVVTAA